MRSIAVALPLLLAPLLCVSQARADVRAFDAGALIVPTDVGAEGAPPADPTDVAYQNYGLLRTFGLVHAWLKEGIAVHWAIDESKTTFDGVDFSAEVRFAPGPGMSAGAMHDYRGGPFVVDAADADRARTILASFNASCAETSDPFCVHVHEAATGFSANVAREMIAAPTIGVLVDGNEAIAFRYLNAAGLLTAEGTPWPVGNCSAADCTPYPEILTEDRVAGCPGASSPSDPGCTPDGAAGELFDADGDPQFCQLMTMHYVPNAWEEATQAAITEFLTDQPTHFFTECDAAERFENEMRLLTVDGITGKNKLSVPSAQVQNGSPFAQAATPIIGAAGSIKRWSVDGAGYRPTTQVHVKHPSLPVGQSDLWASGPAFGDADNGKVSMLGGHSYCPNNLCRDAALDYNDVAGVKYFLNSLFEAPCVTQQGQAVLELAKNGPAAVDGDVEVTWTIDVPNVGVTAAKQVVVVDTLPDDTQFVSASAGGVYDDTAHTVRWDLGRIEAGDDETLTVTVALLANGAFVNEVTAAHRVALTTLRVRDTFTTTATNVPLPPSRPVVTAPADGSATNEPAVVVEGSADPGVTVEVYSDGALAGTATADGSGSFSVTLSAQADGTYELTAVAVDGSGRESPASAPVTVTVDTVAPAAPVILSPTDGSTTSEDTPTLTGTAEPGATVRVSLDGTVVATVTADADGGWSYTVDDGAPLADGAHTVEVTATDRAGNNSPSAQAGFTVGGAVDTTPPDTVLDETPLTLTDRRDATFGFSSTEAGSTFECSVDGGAYAACTSPEVLTALADGDHTFRVRATDPAGNTDPTPAVFGWTVAPGFFLDGGMLPDGGVVVDGSVVFPDGGVLPDGAVLVDGAVVFPDGGDSKDGGVLPDGAVLVDGAIVFPDGGPDAGGPGLDGGVPDDGAGRDRFLLPGVCGNGVVDDGETCDDGNFEASDGCSQTCEVEDGYVCDDYEPTFCVEAPDWGYLQIGGGGCDCRQGGGADLSWLLLAAALTALRRRRGRGRRAAR